MTEQRAPLPTVVFWFRVYAGFMIAMYTIILVAGIILTWFGRSRSFEETGFLLILGILYIAMGLIFSVGYSLGFVFRPSPSSWVYNLVLICIGLTGCPTMAACIPLLIYWFKPETKAFYGRN